MIRPFFPNPILFGFELIFSTFIILLCLIIYFKTKEAFKLTKHRGIEYFRKTFLFLAFAYLFRFISSALMIFSITNGIRFPRFLFGPLSLIFVSYFSTMAIIYLFLSISWKRLNWKGARFIVPIIAVMISLVAFFSREPLIIILIQAVLIVSAAILSFKLHKKSAKFSKLSAIYILLFIFWMIGLAPLSARRPFPHEFVLIIHALSFIIFMIILYKVHKWLK